MPRQLRRHTMLAPSLSTNHKPKPMHLLTLTHMQDAARQQEQMLRELFDYTQNSRIIEEEQIPSSLLCLQENTEPKGMADYYSDKFDNQMEEEHFNIFIEHQSQSLFSFQNSSDSNGDKSQENFEMVDSNEYETYFSY